MGGGGLGAMDGEKPGNRNKSKGNKKIKIKSTNNDWGKEK